MEINKLSNQDLLRWFEACCNGENELFNHLDPLSLEYAKLFKKIESQILSRMKA